MSEYETVHELVDRVTSVSYRLDRAIERQQQGNWYPACGGTEVPFISRSGVKMLYCWQPSTGKHGYIDCGRDMLMTDDDVRNALQTY
jgi:hypothetical protein